MRSVLLALAIAIAARSGGAQERVAAARWDSDSLGNHRVIVRVTEAGDAVRVRIAWRRRDAAPERVNIIVTSATTGARIANVGRGAVGREAGDLFFQPAAGAGDYAVYYLPFRRTNRSANYPKVEYQRPVSTADAAWLARHRDSWRSLPEASVVASEAADSIDVFTAMESIATAGEVEALLARHPAASYLVFAEERDHVIRMSADLPARWASAEPGAPFAGSADRGEFYVLQLGVFAARDSVSDVRVTFGDLRGPSGRVIPQSALRCFNNGGTNWQGKPFAAHVSVARGRVQPLWIGIDVPGDALAGDYRGAATITPRNAPATTVELRLHVAAHTVAAHGDDEPSRLSRLRWLDSRLAIDDGIVPPFVPVSRRGDTVSVLGRSVVVGAGGLPIQALSRFADGNTRIAAGARAVLAAPIAIAVDTGGGVLSWRAAAPRFTPRPPGAVEWDATSDAGALTMRTHARMEFDGNVELQVAITASRTTSVRDIRLDVPYAREVARYLMGLGKTGGTRPPELHWKWDVKRNQDAIWIGDVTAGMQVSLKSDDYSRPLNTNFYQLKPLVMPRSWSNGGAGGCDVTDDGARAALLRCYSGARTIAPGEVLRYDFRLLVTPFKTIRTRAHFTQRYFHAFAPVDTVAKVGANVINVHHRTPINPYLNYPFLRPAAMKAYIDEAHRKAMKVKIYYTVRELSDHAPEMFALESLGHEVFSAGSGGGASWLQEHFPTQDYTAGWYVPEIKDATVVTNGESRWHNAYIEGLDWLARNVGIDGIYLDDVAFDRGIMQRVRKVLDRRRHAALIDLHSATQYNPADGFASSANLYLEYFPYIDRLWFGEGFDYIKTPPDYWLVEISGIPFGLMGEMLEGGGNPWRGMVYGMTNRVYNDDPAYHGDPRNLWKAWDAFGITGSAMHGYWDARTPVTTGRGDVLATTYVRAGRAMVAIGSWAGDTARVQLRVDWRALGIDSTRATVVAPAIRDFQGGATFAPNEPISIAPGKGALLIISVR